MGHARSSLHTDLALSSVLATEQMPGKHRLTGGVDSASFGAPGHALLAEAWERNSGRRGEIYCAWLAWK